MGVLTSVVSKPEEVILVAGFGPCGGFGGFLNLLW